MQRKLIGLATTAVLLASCQTKDVFEPGWERAIGQMDPSHATVQAVSAPATATVNVPFSVTVRTLGSSICTRVANTEVSVTGLTVTVTPYDEYARTMPYCTNDQKAFEHTASVTVASPGTATIRVSARSLQGVPINIDRVVTVQ